jgi:DNA-binding transcriptional regulator GbsR (MarR family)
METGGDKRLGEWIEAIALHFAQVGGLPLIAGRIVGWLMVCEPAEQSADQIAAGIDASRASLSTNLRLLISAGMVSVSSRRGERVRYYRIDNRAWEAAVRVQIAGLASFIQITTDGIALVGEDDPRALRLKAANSVFSWMVEVFEKAPPVPKAGD